MATRTQLAETVLLTVVFFGTVWGLIYLRGQYAPASGTLFTPMLVVIALAPILFFLVATGRLERFSGGGFEIELRKQTQKSLSLETLENPIDYDVEDITEKDIDMGGQSLEKIERMREERSPAEMPTTLAFELEREEYYSFTPIRGYVSSLSKTPNFRYVLFTLNERVEGYMHAEDFHQLLLDRQSYIVEELETGAIVDRNTVRHSTLPLESSNRDAFRAMDEADVDELAVVDPEGAFVGVVTQSELVRTLLATTIDEA